MTVRAGAGEPQGEPDPGPALQRHRQVRIFFRIFPMARSASTALRRSPSIRASIISRPDLVAIDEATESILMPASCSTLVPILHVIPDADDPWRIVARIMDAVPTGSCLVISHAGSDFLGRGEQDGTETSSAA